MARQQRTPPGRHSRRRQSATRRPRQRRRVLLFTPFLDLGLLQDRSRASSGLGTRSSAQLTLNAPRPPERVGRNRIGHSRLDACRAPLCSGCSSPQPSLPSAGGHSRQFGRPGPPEVRAGLPVSQHELGFSQAPLGIAWPDDTTWGDWYSLHDGFGRTAVVNERTGRMLRISTRTPRDPSESYSSLVHSTRSFGDVDFTVRVRTVKQHRPVPRPWEVGWVLWRYTDNEHFDWFIVKPDG